MKLNRIVFWIFFCTLGWGEQQLSYWTTKFVGVGVQDFMPGVPRDTPVFISFHFFILYIVFSNLTVETLSYFPIFVHCAWLEQRLSDT